MSNVKRVLLQKTVMKVAPAGTKEDSVQGGGADSISFVVHREIVIRPRNRGQSQQASNPPPAKRELIIPPSLFLHVLSFLYGRGSGQRGHKSLVAGHAAGAIHQCN